MKEEYFKKHLDNILIDGLIKKAEQDNADFEAAMRGISNEAFDEIVLEPEMVEYKNMRSGTAGTCYPVAASMTSESYDNEEGITAKSSRTKIFRPWIAAALSAAAIITIVLIPSINFMNGKLCDSAIYISEAYITASKGGLDLSTATEKQIKDALPSLEARYENVSMSGIYTQDFPEAAWDLAVAYMKLHKKSDAVKVLKTLESQTKGTPMGMHCKKLLQQLN